MNKTKIHKTQRGFTLIELMITVAIVGILTAIAIPSYSGYVQKSRRTSAETALLDLASREAKYYSTNNAYTNSMTSLGYASAGPIAVPDATSNYYNLSVALNGTGFTATAAPVGNQTADACGSFTIDYLGVKGAGATKCW
ncbi:MAG TPA: type IV pilin protein [Methylobacter sp.]|jgi:type IV pilus assembly protein PilE